MIRIRQALHALGRLPHQGTPYAEAGRDGLRHVTRDRTVIYFHVDDSKRTIFVLAIFFGGQDHHRHMIQHLRTRKTGDT